MNFGRVRSQCTIALKGEGCKDTGLFKGGQPACSLSIGPLKSSAPYLAVCVPDILFLEKEKQDEKKKDDHLIC